MADFISALPQWLLVVVGVVFLLVLLERIYVSKKPIIIAGKTFGPPSPDSAVEKVGKSNRPDEYQPFILTQRANTDLVKHVSDYAASWEQILQVMAANEFFALHSWYNEAERHDLALLCLDVAIARGMATSKNFSFRSASLRKLGRLREALHSAKLAIELDSANVDAYYNLSKIYKEMGKMEEAMKHVKIVLDSGHGIYDVRVYKAFPELGTEKA